MTDLANEHKGPETEQKKNVQKLISLPSSLSLFPFSSCLSYIILSFLYILLFPIVVLKVYYGDKEEYYATK